MDISDILQDLNSRSVDHDPFADDADIGGIGARDGQRSGQTDLQALTRAWVNERGASELLQYANDPPLSSLLFFNHTQYELEKMADAFARLDGPKMD